jgi:mannosyltransferase
MRFAKNGQSHSGTLGKWIVTHRTILLLSLITGIGLFLRFYTLGSESIWFDEAASIFSAKQPVIDMLKACVAWQRHPPLHFITLKMWINLFGDSEVSVRMLSAIFGIASIPLIFLVGKKLFNDRVGLLASFLLSISSFAIYYSQETRAYAMLLFLTLLSFVFFIRIMKHQDAGKLYFIAYFITNTLLIYTHYFGLFVIASQLFYFILVKKYNKINTRSFWYAQIATGIAFVPWAVVFVGYSIPQSYSWPRPTLTSLVNTFGEYSGYSNVRYWLLPILGFFCILGLHSWRQNFSQEQEENSFKTFHWGDLAVSFNRNVLLVLVWLAFPIILPFLISQIPLKSTGIYITRYTISALPAFLLLVASGMRIFLTRKALYPLFSVILIGITWFSGTGLQNYYAQPHKEQWREAVLLSQPLIQEDDVIILSNPSFIIALNYYYKGDVERLALNDGNEKDEIAAIIAQGKNRVWLYQGGWGSTNTRDYLLNTLGEKSLLLDKKLVGVEVYLFDFSGLNN